MRVYLLLIFICMLVMGNAVASDQANISPHQSLRTIDVTGVGNIFSVPDRFSFSLSIEQKGGIAAQLNKAIVEKTNAVVQALFKVGVDKKAVQSLQVQFNPWIEYDGKTREQKGFILTRQVKVTLKTLAQYEQSIDAVLKLGISSINQFSFIDSKADENYQGALKQALLNAQQRATDMAKVLDLKLVGVISISEKSFASNRPMAMRSGQFIASESYQPGEMSIQATVKVIFALDGR